MLLKVSKIKEMGKGGNSDRHQCAWIFFRNNTNCGLCRKILKNECILKDQGLLGFPGGPVVRTLPFPGRGIKILHAMQCGGKKKTNKKKQLCKV